MMLEMKTTDFLEALSSGKPVPGGGGASASVGALGAALGMMVTNLTVGKKKYADVEEEIIDIRSRLKELRDELVGLTDEDARVFEPLSRAYGMPKDTPEQQAQKDRVMEQALNDASIVPLRIMKTVLECMKCLKILGEKGSRLAVSDVGVGILFAQAAVEGASLNVFINTKMMKDKAKAQELNKETVQIIEAGKELQETVYAKVLNQLGVSAS